MFVGEEKDLIVKVTVFPIVKTKNTRTEEGFGKIEAGGQIKSWRTILIGDMAQRFDESVNFLGKGYKAHVNNFFLF